MNQDQPKIGMNPMSLVFFICMLTLALCDLGFVVFGGVNSSLSWWLVRHTMGEKYIPYMPPLAIMLVGIGTVLGHLFFPMRITEKAKE